MRTCNEYENLISRMLDEDLSASECHALNTHLEECHSCQKTYHAFTLLSEHFPQVQPAPQDLISDVMSQIAPTHLHKVRRYTVKKWGYVLCTAAACIALMILGLNQSTDESDLKYYLQVPSTMHEEKDLQQENPFPSAAQNPVPNNQNPDVGPFNEIDPGTGPENAGELPMTPSSASDISFPSKGASVNRSGAIPPAIHSVSLPEELSPEQIEQPLITDIITDPSPEVPMPRSGIAPSTTMPENFGRYCAMRLYAAVRVDLVSHLTRNASIYTMEAPAALSRLASTLAWREDYGSIRTASAMYSLKAHLADGSIYSLEIFTTDDMLICKDMYGNVFVARGTADMLLALLAS